MSQRYHPMEKWYETKSFNKTNRHGPWNVYHVVNDRHMKTYQHKSLICFPSCPMRQWVDMRRKKDRVSKKLVFPQLVFVAETWECQMLCVPLSGHICSGTSAYQLWLSLTTRWHSEERFHCYLAQWLSHSGGKPLSSGINLNISINQAMSLINQTFTWIVMKANAD